jgi:hypothetical protein
VRSLVDDASCARRLASASSGRRELDSEAALGPPLMRKDVGQLNSSRKTVIAHQIVSVDYGVYNDR